MKATKKGTTEMTWDEYQDSYIAQIARRYWQEIRERHFYPPVDILLE